MNKKIRISLFIGFLLTSFFVLSPHLQAQKAAKKSKKDYVVTIATNYGDIYVVLFDDTPQHKANFIKLVQSGFYDSTTFHRVLKDFVIQGGDPNAKPGAQGEIGRGGPGYDVPAEFVTARKHDYGVLAAARMPDNVNPKKASSGSQFYIVQAPKGAHHLDGSYTVFGKVVKGMDVVERIAAQEVNKEGRPTENIYMTAVATLMKKKHITELFGYQYEK